MELAPQYLEKNAMLIRFSPHDYTSSHYDSPPPLSLYTGSLARFPHLLQFYSKKNATACIPGYAEIESF